MAHSQIRTLLSLDEYARIMAIPGWLFNQVTHPARPQRGNCEVLYQSGYLSDPNRIVGRDEIARAIAVAEEKIAVQLGFWPAPKWICNDEVIYPTPKRGHNPFYSELETSWGYVIEGGVEAYEALSLDEAIVYTDEDDDGYVDTGTITVSALYDLYDDFYDLYPNVGGDVDDVCEVIVVPAGKDPEREDWRIRPIDIEMDDDGNITIEIARWQLVKPSALKTPEPLEMDVDDHFLETVDIYRRYNDPSTHARFVWRNEDTNRTIAHTCNEKAQTGCIVVRSSRPGIIKVTPAAYTTANGWIYQQPGVCNAPYKVRLWYKAGYRESTCRGCETFSESLAEAIVRLANVYLPEAPCGCDYTKQRWAGDRTELEVLDWRTSNAMNVFGTSAAGAVFALSVVNKLPALGKGG